MKDWLAFAINAAAATVFFAMAFRLRNRSLLYVGLAFVAACVVMGFGFQHPAPEWVPVGYALGLAASVAGYFALTTASRR